jgi:Ca-activated chloride channel family protein
MDKAELHQTLPDISKFDLVVNPPSAANEVAVEIFTSVEKAGKGFDGWMVEVANDFNRSNIRLRNGHIAKVRIRAIASGEAINSLQRRSISPTPFLPPTPCGYRCSPPAISPSPPLPNASWGIRLGL